MYINIGVDLIFKNLSLILFFFKYIRFGDFMLAQPVMPEQAEIIKVSSSNIQGWPQHHVNLHAILQLTYCLWESFNNDTWKIFFHLYQDMIDIYHYVRLRCTTYTLIWYASVLQNSINNSLIIIFFLGWNLLRSNLLATFKDISIVILIRHHAVH